MFVPLPTLAGLFEGRSLFAAFASAAGAIAFWAQAHAGNPEDPIQDLTERVRHPVIYAIKHPIRSIAKRFTF